MKLKTAVFKYALVALGILLLAPQAMAQVASPDFQIGIIGTQEKSPLQLAEARISYRFDQVGTGKSAQSVPVQMTYRLHNPDKAQNLEINLPVQGPDGVMPEVTAVFVNGQERTWETQSAKNYTGIGTALNSISIPLEIAQDADVIIDIRATQPIAGENVPFGFSTGRGWSDKITTGTLEAFFPFTTANWNLALKKSSDQSALPLVYSGKSASWSFSDLDPATAEDVYWQIADLRAMNYYEQGLDRWRQDNNDPQAFEMLFDSLMDMIPCHGEKMPSDSWWRGMYDTLTVGKLSTLEGEEQSATAMELYSADYAVPQDGNQACIEMRQRPERYIAALKKLLDTPKDQRSAIALRALEKHYVFLRKLAILNGDNSLNEKITDVSKEDPYGQQGLSDKDRELMSKWDERFSTPASQKPGTTTNTTGTNNGKGNKSATTVVSTWIDNLPNLSFGTQVALFAGLAILILIIIGYIIFKWQENPVIPARPVDNKPKDATPVAGFGLGRTMEPPVSRPTESKHEPENIIAQDKPTETRQNLPKPPSTPPPPINTWPKPDTKPDDNTNKPPQSGPGPKPPLSI